MIYSIFVTSTLKCNVWLKSGCPLLVYPCDGSISNTVDSPSLIPNNWFSKCGSNDPDPATKFNGLVSCSANNASCRTPSHTCVANWRQRPAPTRLGIVDQQPLLEANFRQEHNASQRTPKCERRNSQFLHHLLSFGKVISPASSTESSSILLAP